MPWIYNAAQPPWQQTPPHAFAELSQSWTHCVCGVCNQGLKSGQLNTICSQIHNKPLARLRDCFCFLSPTTLTCFTLPNECQVTPVHHLLTWPLQDLCKLSHTPLLQRPWQRSGNQPFCIPFHSTPHYHIMNHVSDWQDEALKNHKKERKWFIALRLL